MKTLSITLAAIAIMVGVSCSESETDSFTTAQQNAQDVQRPSMAPVTPTLQLELSVYQSQNQYKVLLTRLTPHATAYVLASGANFSKIFSTKTFYEPQEFKPVLNTINTQSDFFCISYVIKFDDDVTPYQFHSMAEIEQAINNGEVIVTSTDQVFSCVFL